MKKYKIFLLITGFILLYLVKLVYIASLPSPDQQSDVMDFQCQAANPDHTINLCLEEFKEIAPTVLSRKVSGVLMWSSIVKTDDNMANKIIAILKKQSFIKVDDQTPNNVFVSVHTEKMSSKYLVIVVGFSKREP